MDLKSWAQLGGVVVAVSRDGVAEFVFLGVAAGGADRVDRPRQCLRLLEPGETETDEVQQRLVKRHWLTIVYDWV